MESNVLGNWKISCRRDSPGRPGFAGSIPERVFAFTRTGPRPGSAGSRAGPGLKTLVSIVKVGYNSI